MKMYMAPLVVAGLAASASAQVSNFIGNLQQDTAPLSLAAQAYESNGHISLISETMSHVLADDLAVDASGTGLYDSSSVLSQSMIPGGTKVDSWMLHSDPVGVITSWDNSLVLGGGVTFDRKILGVMVLDSSLDASDAEVGHAGTFYAISEHRGMELDLYCPILKYDAFTISADEHSISMIMHTDRKIDEIRVITEALGPIPAPGAAGLLGLGGLMAVRRRR
jgi:hypothetical protein